MYGSESSSDGGWISWFIELEGHEFFVEVDVEYIRDSFNLFGLRERVPLKYNEAINMIL